MKLANLRLVAVDIGNSRLKLLYKKRSAAFEYNKQWSKGVYDFLQKCGTVRPAFGISSVNPQRLKEFLTVFGTQAGYSYMLLNPLLTRKNMPVGLSRVKGMGADRVLGLYGALAQTAPPVITVDCGTAITVNALDNNAQCLGGAILPGINTQLRALHTFTGQLPVIAPIYTQSTTGTNTKEAMRIGAIRGAAGAVLHIIDRIKREYFPDSPLPVFITGGEAPLLLREMPAQQAFLYRKELVREGIIYCAEQLINDGYRAWTHQYG